MLCFRKLPVAKKSLDKREGEVSRFSFEKFCLTVPKKFVGEPIRESVIAGVEKFYASEGYVTIFHRNFFVSQHRNVSQRNLSMLCIRKFPVAKKFMDKR